MFRRPSKPRNVVVSPGSRVPQLVRQSRKVLGLTQAELGAHLNVSAKTAIRLERGFRQAESTTLCILARLVYPKDASLAATLAAEGGSSLIALGLTKPAPPAVVRPQPTLAHLSRVALFAAAEAGTTTTIAVRPMVLAALEQLRELGVSVEEAIQGIQEAPPPGKPRKLPGCVSRASRGLHRHDDGRHSPRAISL